MFHRLSLDRLRFPRESLVALAFHTVKTVLAEAGKEALFPYIQAISITSDRVEIVTHKPIANAELAFFRTAFETSFREKASRFGIRLEFRFFFR